MFKKFLVSTGFTKTCRSSDRVVGITNNRSMFARNWHGKSDKQISEQDITTLLRKKFPNASDIQVTDISSGCGEMFKIFVESGEFKGLSVINQHRCVTDALKNEVKQMHGLRVETKIP